MNFFDNPHYQAIREYYGQRRAKRSGRLYIQHIDEGLVLLASLQATISTCEAFCLHPIVQSDEAFLTAFDSDSVLRRNPIDVYAMALVMEYRSVANDYQSTRQIESTKEIRLSPLLEVRQMLIADKVQNRKDFERYHLGRHPRSEALVHYFRNWLEALGISETHYRKLVQLIE